MGKLISTAGSRIFIGSLPKVNNGPDFILADFAGVTWVEIMGHTALGKIGDTSGKQSSQQIGISRVRKGKGPRDAGSQDLVCDVDYTDSGQLQLRTAEKSADSYPIKMVLPKGGPKASTVTMTIASPGVVTWNTHGLAAGDAIKFSTTGALPTGVTAGTTYYVIATGLTANSFQFSATVGGSAVATTGTQSGTHTAETVPTGPERYYTAFVMTAAEQYDQADSIMKLNSTLEIDSNIVTNP